MVSGEAVAGKVRRRQILGGISWRQVPWAPLLIMAAFVMIGAFAPLVAPYSYAEGNLADKLKPPVWMEGGSIRYILGTDALGRDLLSRVLLGTRYSLLATVLVLLLGGGVGLALGILSGYLGGKVDSIVSRAMDAMLAFPAILFALLFAVTLGPSLNTVIIALSLVMWARFARIMRGEVLSVRERDFIAYAKIDGCSPLRIMAVHILPNVANTFMVLASLNAGYVIIVEASLSFLGAGIPPPIPSWGGLTAEGKDFIGTAWWLSVIPGTCVALVVLAMNLFGDWLRDTLDPKLKQI